ncbi:hypothetical protein K9L63_00865 [Candidatus Gracilibacteria bacterium]|nr:hypothetical protein [Candidatus Gracilibacteria bacterium]
MSEKFEGNLPPQEQKGEIPQELLDLCKGNQETAQKVLAVRSKYDNEWWNSNDPMEVAMGQLNEPTLIMDFGKFHEAIEKALGRPVYTHEFGINADGLKEELAEKKSEK